MLAADVGDHLRVLPRNEFNLGCGIGGSINKAFVGCRIVARTSEIIRANSVDVRLESRI